MADAMTIGAGRDDAALVSVAAVGLPWRRPPQAPQRAAVEPGGGHEGPRAGLDRAPAGQAAPAGRSRSAERPARDRARGSARAAGVVPAPDSRRRRLLRSGGHVRRRVGDRGDDARRHDVADRRCRSPSSSSRLAVDGRRRAGTSSTDASSPARPDRTLRRDRSRSPPTCCSTRRSRTRSSTRYKERTRAGLIQQRTSPGFLANEMFSRVVYGDPPGRRASRSPRRCSTR